MDETYAQVVMERCDTLATLSEEPERLTRRFATSALQQTNALVLRWMGEAGMSARQDQVGNVRGRYEADHAGAKTLLLGSHLDTVRDAGKYDGMLGVLVALACVQRLHDQGIRLPFAIELLGFADEEGVRYGVPYLGSMVVAGSFDPALLAQRDADDIAMADAIRAFGGDPAQLAAAQRAGADLLGYCEVHIEQGPALEAQNLPVGVVTAIAGQNRFTVSFSGMAGHAGTVPMSLRRDALCAAAEFVLQVEALGQHTPGLMATVGQIEAQPGAGNVIPGVATISLDVRHHDDAVRENACRLLREQAAQIAERRRVTCTWDTLQARNATLFNPALTALLGEAVAALGYPVHTLPSGAGHDAVVMSALTPIAMLFVRCAGGISHNPAEAVETADVAVAVDVLSRFLNLLAAHGTAA